MCAHLAVRTRVNNSYREHYKYFYFAVDFYRNAVNTLYKVEFRDFC